MSKLAAGLAIGKPLALSSFHSRLTYCGGREAADCGICAVI
jgi:hypothetical protein